MPIIFGVKVPVGPKPPPNREQELFENQFQKRPLAHWCQAFAKSGRWEDVRELKCWCKTAMKDGCELVYRIAIRHELFSRIKADRRLIEMGSNKFARRCERYKVGKPGGQAERPHGKWALVFDDGFVEDLIGTADVEPEEVAGKEG